MGRCLAGVGKLATKIFTLLLQVERKGQGVQAGFQLDQAFAFHLDRQRVQPKRNYRCRVQQELDLAAAGDIDVAAHETENVRFLAVRLLEDKLGACFTYLDAGEQTAFSGGNDQRVVVLLDRLVRLENGLDQIVDGRTGADANKVGADQTAGTRDGVALEAGLILAAEDYLAA